MEVRLVPLVVLLAVFSFHASRATERTLCTTTNDDLLRELEVVHLLPLCFKVRHKLAPGCCDNSVDLLIVFLVEVNKAHKGRDVRDGLG